MSNCEACMAQGRCKNAMTSRFYHREADTKEIVLLGQPNAGKSTIFNLMTGSHQHVGNWPGKTVEQKEGEFTLDGKRMIVVDLPGSYSLSSGSEEEVITRDYIRSENADLVLIMADASQLKRSLYMLADYAGTKTPAVLVLNMIDVAKAKGIRIDVDKISERLGIPVVPMSAIRKKDYSKLYQRIGEILERRSMIDVKPMETTSEKLSWIDQILEGAVHVQSDQAGKLTKFDRIVLSPVRGKLIAFGIILVVFVLSMCFAAAMGGAAAALIGIGRQAIGTAMVNSSVSPLIISLVCDVLLNVLYFAVMMASFVLGITFGFNLMEESGYLARLSFLFDRTMSRVGLQGKAIMPFFMGLGCTIAGATGTRVVDNWGQRVLAIAMSWAVPCAATLSVVPTIAIALYGGAGGFAVMAAMFAFVFVMMWAVYKMFGRKLSPASERGGLIMEMPPYHKPNVHSVCYVTFRQTLDIFWRALKVISIVSVIFFLLTYGYGGDPKHSLIYQLGVLIEPVTMLFGMKWEAFMAFCASAISKESLLGVLNSLYGTGGSVVASTFGAKMAGSSMAVSDLLAAHFTKAEGLAFIFAISFNMPCVNALAATAREAHSVRWTAKIGLFYTVASLLVAGVIYHIGLLIF